MELMRSTRSSFLHWVESGAIDVDRATEAASVVHIRPDASRWLRLVDLLLLAAGALALASGVVFFIAFNWDALGRFGKFAGAQVLTVAAVVLYWRLGATKVTAQVALLVAALLLGALLALYGQTYQTGADPWQLFATWALLMLPWAAIGRFAPLWLLWLLLLNLSAALYYDARFGLLGVAFASKDDLVWILFLLNSAAWTVWEMAAARFAWLSPAGVPAGMPAGIAAGVMGRWPVRLIATASGFALTVLVLRSIYDPDSPPIALAWGVWFIWLGGLYFVYRRRLPIGWPHGRGDLYMLAGACLSAIVCLTSLLAHWLLRGSEPAGAFLLLAVLVVGQAAAAAAWLRQVHVEQAR
jgi:uncharacterized membrane protein